MTPTHLSLFSLCVFLQTAILLPSILLLQALSNFLIIVEMGFCVVGNIQRNEASTLLNPLMTSNNHYKSQKKLKYFSATLALDKSLRYNFFFFHLFLFCQINKFGKLKQIFTETTFLYIHI